MFVSCRRISSNMKRHLCRHCGLVVDTYAELKRHVESHSIAPPSDLTKKAKYSCKCDETFERWDSLQHHVRTACRLKKKNTTYTCTKCGKNFYRIDSLTRHTQSTCSGIKKLPYTCTKCGKNFYRIDALTRNARTCIDKPPPPPPKRSNVEDTTLHHPLVTEEDPLDPPARLPFADNLSTELLDVVREHWRTIRTRVTRGPLQRRYDYRLTTLDTTVLETPLKKMYQEQTNAFKINLSYGFVLRNKNTGRYKYYHSSCNCCGRYLDEPSLVTNSEDFDVFLERIRETDVLQWAINQRPDSAWVCELVTNVTFFVNLIIDHPIGCVNMTPLPVYIKKNKAVICLETDPKYGKRYTDNLCLFRCLALHRGCDVRRLEPSTKTLYEAYNQDEVPMEQFTGVTMKDLYRVETTFQTNVCRQTG